MIDHVRSLDSLSSARRRPFNLAAGAHRRFAALRQRRRPGSPAASNPVCVRLESQLAILNRGSADPARADQIKRYEDAIAKQQADLDRALAQSKKQGCEGGGFFALFTGQSPQCQPLNAQIQQIRDNLDHTMSDLERLKSGNTDQEGQRRALIGQLAQNNCGPQYSAPRRRPRDRAVSSTRCFRRHDHQSRRRRRAVRHLSHRLRAHLRRILLPDLLLDGAEPVRRRSARLPARVPRRRSRALQLSQSRRGHQPGGVDQRPAVYRIAERLSLSQGVHRQPVPADGRVKAGPMR